jgi:general secretion pathway protein D
MSIRLPFAPRTPAGLLLIGSLVLPFFASPNLPAAEVNPCPPQQCGRCLHAQGVAPKPSLMLVRVTYQVADLIVPVPGGVIAGDPVSPASKDETREESLIKLITKTVEPPSWSDRAGPGTIDYHPLTMSLVINQTPDIQERVHDLLKSLRRLQDQEVVLEVRFISVDESFADRLSAELKGGETIKQTAASDSPLRTSLLDAAGQSRLLEAIQADCRANVLQAPKMTFFSGQSANWEAVEKKSFITGVDIRTTSDGNPMFQQVVEEVPVGMRMAARPVISADRRTVNLGLSVNLIKLDDPECDFSAIALQPKSSAEQGEPSPTFTQLLQHPHISRFGLDSTFTIPDGSTALISGWKREHGVRTENAVPLLSDIPYVGELFKNVTYTREKECVLMMVTPRIIVAEEKEEKAPTE